MNVKIYCTVEEFADLVRGCHEMQENHNCSKCALYRVCREYDGTITQFVDAASILPEAPKEE